VSDLPNNARKIVERIMSGNVYQIDLESCRMMSKMADIIESLELKVTETEKKLEELKDMFEKKESKAKCGKKGCKKTCQNGASMKRSLLLEKK